MTNHMQGYLLAEFQRKGTVLPRWALLVYGAALSVLCFLSDPPSVSPNKGHRCLIAESS